MEQNIYKEWEGSLRSFRLFLKDNNIKNVYLHRCIDRKTTEINMSLAIDIPKFFRDHKKRMDETFLSLIMGKQFIFYDKKVHIILCLSTALP
jgi:mannitol/fructose-specific phosphotransferase system IIA component